MRTFLHAVIAAAALVGAPATAHPGDDTVARQPQSAAPTPSPEAAPPAEGPAPTSTGRPALPAAPARSAAPQPPPPQPPSGAWVWSDQYGWVWLPYGEGYTRGGPTGYSAYVYRPYFGWVWVVDPWPWGFWPWPVYNSHWWGPHARFGWYPGHAPGFSGGPRGHHGPGVAPPGAAPRPSRRR